MNSLLKRQLRKYLPKELHSSPDLEQFLDAVNKSYNNSDEQFAMLQKTDILYHKEINVSKPSGY